MTQDRLVAGLTRVLIGLTVACGPAMAQGIITTLAGTGACGFTGDGGPATSAQLCSAQTPAVDASGNVYFPDNHRIRKVSPDGTITTIAGTGAYGTTGDGGPALSATMGWVYQVAVYGTLVCFGDTAEEKVRCVDLSSGLIWGLSPTFQTPEGIAFDNAGNLFVSNFSGNSIQRIDYSTGGLTTVAGPGPGYCCAPLGDGGPAVGADLYEPMGIYYNQGALYIADTGNSRIRRVDLTTGIITSVNAGGSPFSTNGRWIAMDPSGNLFVSAGTAVQEIDTSGNLTTVAGVLGISGYGYDDIPATQSYSGGINGIGWDPVGKRLLITDTGTRVRQVFYTPPTTTTLTTSANPVPPGTQVTLQATVSPVTATGNVRFYQNITLLGSVALTNSNASFVWTAPPGGANYSLRAVYGGDANDNLSTSATITETVGQAPTSATLSSTPNPSVPGQNVTFTFVVTPATATGTVNLVNGSTQLGSTTLSNGVATFTVSNLAAGSDYITANYNGSSSFIGSSASRMQTVLTASAITLATAPNPAIYGAAVILTSAVSPAAATGSVQFFIGSALLGTATLASGQAQLSVTSLPVGSDSLTAVYSGDSNYASSTSAAVAEVVQYLPAGSITSSANPSIAGTPIVFTATISQPAATGTITFQDYGTSTTSYIVLGTAPVVNGVATYSTSGLSTGTHNIGAAYSGDANDLAFSLPLLSELVTQSGTGLITTIAGTGTSGTAGVGGPAASAQLAGPFGIVTDSSDNLFLADTAANRVVRIDAITGILTLVAGNGAASSAGDSGPATQASLNRPYAVVLDASGNLFISEYSGHRIRRVDATTGIITTLAGTGAAGFSGDGASAATAQLSSPMGLAFDPTGNLFVADAGNTRIRRIDAVTGFITTIAGNGTSAFTADGAAASGASLAMPLWVSVDRSGNVLISEFSSQRIRRIDATTGLLSTVAGDGVNAFTGDGISAAAVGIGPMASNVVADPAGNLFFADGTGRIRRVDAGTGLITSVAGNGSGAQGMAASAGGTGGPSCYSTVAGDNGPAAIATLDGPAGVALTKNGNLILADWLDCRARRVFLPSPSPYTNTIVTASASTITTGQSVTLTATVTPIGVSGTPTGTIQFVDAPSNLGATALGSATLSGGSASLAVSTLAANTQHQIVAYYSGDASFNGSGSPGLPVTVTLPVPAVSLASSQNPTIPQQAIWITVTVTPPGAGPAPTGSVQLLDGSASLGTGSLQNGAAQFSITFTTLGTHSLTAVYSGDSNYLGSTSAVFSQPVKNNSSGSLTSDVNPSAVGATVTFTATVFQSAATETIQFVDTSNNSAVLGTVTVSGSKAVLAVSTLTAGTHVIVAIYSGDANYVGFQTSLYNQVVKPTTGTSVTSSVNPSASGQAVTLTATVSPSSATGTVQFMDGTTSLGTATLTGGTASLSTTTLGSGTHNITAVYSGDSNNASSTSAVLVQTVKFTTTTAVTSSGASTYGQSVTFTASVTPNTATGTVQFLDGGTALGTAALSGGAAALSVSSLTAGAHSITAVYIGDGLNTGSTSAVFTQNVAKASVMVALSATPNPALAGQTVTLTATISPTAATGTVQFLDGTTILGTSAVSSGTASYSTSALAPAVHSFTAVYSGDANFSGFTSPSAGDAVQGPTTTTVSSNNATAYLGQAILFTAVVSPAGATGSVQFKDGTTLLGTSTIGGGAAVFQTSTLALGTHQITAAYAGDATHAPSASAAWTQTVAPPPPAPPMYLTAAAASAVQINLSWTASPTSGVTYNVYGSTSPGFAFTAANRIASGVTTTSFVNIGLSPSTTYYYAVTAQSSAGESAPSNPASATTPAAPSLSCHITYNVTNQWNVGFTTAITIQNTGSKPIHGWTLTWTWPGNQQIYQAWNSNYSQNGQHAALTNANWNANIAGGATVTGVGFNASYIGSNPPPASFSVNGTPCH